MDDIERVELLDAQLKVLEKVMKRGSYVAAGLTISINVGPLQEDCEPDLTVELGLTADLAGLLAIIHAGMKESRRWRVGNARKELDRLKQFLDKEPT